VEELLKTVTEKLAEMVETKTVVGDPITVEGRTILPVTKVSFGFGSGGGEGKGKEGEGGGSGGGGGASIEPIAFLVISKDDVKLANIKGKGALSELIGLIPEMMEKYKTFKAPEKKEEEPAKQASSV